MILKKKNEMELENVEPRKQIEDQSIIIALTNKQPETEQLQLNSEFLIQKGGLTNQMNMTKLKQQRKAIGESKDDPILG